MRKIKIEERRNGRYNIDSFCTRRHTSAMQVPGFSCLSDVKRSFAVYFDKLDHQNLFIMIGQIQGLVIKSELFVY